MTNQKPTDDTTRTTTVPIRVDRHSTHVGVLTIHRPEHHNRLDRATLQDLAANLAALESNDDIKVIVIRGEGPDLCAGYDVHEIGELHDPARRPSLRKRLSAHHDWLWGEDGAYSRLLHCSKVTVLAASGKCWDAGLYLTLFADIAVAASSASFAVPRWTHIGADGDLSVLLATVGRKHTCELVFAGATWDADTALRIGLVNQATGTPDSTEAALVIAENVALVMRDAIAAEKFLARASAQKMGFGTGFAVATIAGAMASNIHHRPGEFNFLKAKRDNGLDEALRQAAGVRGE